LYSTNQTKQAPFVRENRIASYFGLNSRVEELIVHQTTHCGVCPVISFCDVDEFTGYQVEDKKGNDICVRNFVDVCRNPLPIQPPLLVSKEESFTTLLFTSVRMKVVSEARFFDHTYTHRGK